MTPPEPQPTHVGLRLLAAVIALGAGVAAVLIAILLVKSTLG
jgi:hypothetical protein